MRATAILLAAALACVSPALAQENPKTKPPSPPGASGKPIWISIRSIGVRTG